LYREEPVTPEEIKLRGARTRTEATNSPSEAESKDLLEPESMKAIENLQCYQNETRAQRDKKVKPKHIEAQENWNLSGPDLSWCQKKQDHDPFIWQTTKAGRWNTLGMSTTSIVSTFS
jgi:hypothetical protein